jgi:hypothetical protein
MFNDFNLQIVVATVSFSAYLWVALYLLSRTTLFSPLIIASFIGSLVQAAYFAHNVVVNIVTGVETGELINRLGWWTNTLPIAIWFHISLLMKRLGKPSGIFPLPAILAYCCALTITLGGFSTNFFIDYHAIFPDRPGHLYAPVGSFYWAFIVYFGAVGISAMFNFLRLYQNMQKGREPSTPAIRQKVLMLAWGALFFLAGGVYLALKVNFFWTEAPDLPAFASLLIGLGLFAYAITHYDLLIEGRGINRDFTYSFSAILLVNIIYTGLIALSGFTSPVMILLLVGLVTTTHTLYDQGRNVLDKFFFNKEEQTARSEARDYASELAIHPVEIPGPLPMEVAPVEKQNPVIEEETEGTLGEKAFKNAVRRAITGLKNPTQLVKSPLLSLKIVEQRLKIDDQEDNRLNRSAALKSLLIELIERLRPNESTISGTTDAWRFYNVLYFPYVREVSKKNAYSEARRLAEERRRNGQKEAGELEQALVWLSDIDEDTFYKWQRRASDMLAEFLMEEENRRQGG